MKVRIAFVIVITWVGLVLGSDQVRADDAALAQAEQHFNKAQTLYKEGKYEEAALEFAAAYQAKDLPPFLFNIGASYEKLAKANPSKLEYWDQAIQYYRQYIEAEANAQDRGEIEARIKVLEGERDRIKAAMTAMQKPEEVQTSAKVEELAEAAIRGLVVVESEPPNANIYLDDKTKAPIGKTPWSGTLEGTHTIYLERSGYKPREMSISPSPDRLVVVSVALAEEGFLGWVDIIANVPGADIYIDDKSVGVFGKTPYSGNLKPGKHKIWIAAEGYKEYATELEVVAGKAHSVNAKLEGSPLGYLQISGKSTERAMIYIDGELVCKRGPCRKAIQQGMHRVLIKRPGYKSYERVVEIQARTETVLNVKLARKQGRGDAVWSYIFSAAFAGGGVYLSLRARDLHDQIAAEIAQGAPPPDSSDPRFTHGKLFAGGADVAYGIAAIFFVAGVYNTFRDKGPASTGSLDMRSIALEPQIGPGYAGLGMEVTW